MTRRFASPDAFKASIEARLNTEARWPWPRSWASSTCGACRSARRPLRRGDVARPPRAVVPLAPCRSPAAPFLALS